MNRSKFLICLGIILLASGVATAYILAFVRFPDMFKSGDTAENIGYLLSTLQRTDYVFIFLAAALKYSGIILILLGVYMWFRTRKALKQTQPQNTVS